MPNSNQVFVDGGIPFGSRIESLLEGSRQLQLELKKFVNPASPYTEKIREWGESNTSLPDPVQNLISDPVRQNNPSMEEPGYSSSRDQGSFDDRLSRSSLFTTLQKLP